MQKRQTVEIFQQRLSELIGRTGQTRARFAAKAGLDRSTLSQLLAEENVRLPRAETIARIASRHSVSIDWLLGLSQQSLVSPDIVAQPVVEPNADDPYNDALKRWHEETRGGKVRYVPSSLPDQVKTEAVIRYENVKLITAAADAMAETAHARIDHARRAESEIEVCSARQSVELFAKGEGIWRQLPLRERRRQLEHMAAMVEELYPSYRWFLFDGRERFSAPYTIFGSKRAAFYVGSMYFVFTSTEHIRELTQHFEDLIRNARVQPNETAAFIRKLTKDAT
jgi:transcriptional regulator with XRE-family HTH domain